MHYGTLEDVEKFLGNKDRGGFHLLSEILYKKFNYRDICPKDIIEMIDNSELENPNYPYFYKPQL
jgi:hypothetical protein